MKRTLPFAYVPQYTICDLCDCPMQVSYRVEIKGRDYTICQECYDDNAAEIRRAIAEDIVGADACEADQEGT